MNTMSDRAAKRSPDNPGGTPRSFDPPQEPEWHQKISEAAYFIAEKRGFVGDQSLDDWLAAEEAIRRVISP